MELGLHKVIEIFRLMHKNNPDEYMTRKDVAQLLTIILHNLVCNETITKAMEELDGKK